MATFLITACSNENDEELISTSTKGILSATVRGLQVMANSTGQKKTN